jgi:hypothetical protein
MLPRLKFAIVRGAACTLGLRGQINEYQVKAFFLYRFARYVEWPTETFKAGWARGNRRLEEITPIEFVRHGTSSLDINK